jgi:hypothetical protein
VTSLRIVDDMVELGGQPVARLLPGVSLSLRDRLTEAFDALDEDAAYIALLEARLKEEAP